MMTGFRNILWLLPVTLLLSWPVWGGAVTRFLTPRGGLVSSLAAPSPATAKDGAGFSMEGVLFSQLKNGALDWQIQAKHLSSGEDPDRMQLETVEAQVFKNGQRKFVITGLGERLLLVTPGIRPGANVLDSADDQTRIMTAGRAITSGADQVVVGRPISKAADPIAVIDAMQQEIAQALQ